MADEPSLNSYEKEIEASRERLAKTIDELAFRAQPKQIVKSQREQLKASVKAKYNSLMGTGQESTTAEPFTAAGNSGTSKLDEVKAKAAGLKDQASDKAHELREQAAGKADELKATATGKAEELKSTATGKAEELKSTATAKIDDVRGGSGATTRRSFADESASSGSALDDAKVQARQLTDQARLKVDQATHDENGDLKMEQIAAVLAVVGAGLIGLGAKQRRG